MASGKISQYGLGFTQGLLVRGLPVTQVHPGRIFWVNNSSVLPDGGIGGSNGNDGTYLRPFSTIDYAVSRCTASRGDIVLVMPGYTQTITAAAEIGLDVAGVAVIGLGAGSLRPTITFGTNATADIDVSAANISIQNFIFIANVASCATCFEMVSATDFTVEHCEFRDAAATTGFINLIDTDAVANGNDGLYFCNNRWKSLDDIAATSALDIDEAIDRMVVNDNFIVCNQAVNSTPVLVDAATFNLTNVEIARNKVYRLGDAATGGILLETSSTASNGFVYDNKATCSDPTAILLITTGSKLGFHNNLVQGAEDLSGFVLPAIDADAS